MRLDPEYIASAAKALLLDMLDDVADAETATLAAMSAAETPELFEMCARLADHAKIRHDIVCLIEQCTAGYIPGGYAVKKAVETMKTLETQ